MKAKLFLPLIFIVFLFQNIFSQEPTPTQQKFFIEIGTGGELSRWQVLKEDPIDKVNSIYKTSVDKLSLPAKIGLSYRVKRFQIGAELKNQYIFITTLQDPSTSTTSDDSNTSGEIKLTDLAGLNFTTLVGLLRYILINSETFKMSPAVGIGSFLEKTIESKKAELKNLISYKFAFQQEFHKENTDFYFTPQIQINRYATLDKLEVNRILTGGVEFGFGFKFPRQASKTKLNTSSGKVIKQIQVD